MSDPFGIWTKIAMIPNAISAMSAQKHARATPERSRRVAYPAAPKPAMKSAVAPPACHTARGSVDA
jgi:hypothetical protein